MAGGTERPPARVVLAWAPAVLYMGLIWVLSSAPIDLPSIERFPLRDKGVHLLEYGLLALLLAHATARTWPDRARVRTAALAVLITVLWGVLDEIHQAFVPGRSSDVVDLLADAAGAIIGAAAFSVGAWLLAREPRRGARLAREAR